MKGNRPGLGWFTIRLDSRRENMIEFRGARPRRMMQLRQEHNYESALLVRQEQRASGRRVEAVLKVSAGATTCRTYSIGIKRASERQ